MNVSNKKIIRKLTVRFLKTSKTRNLIAVIAIALTSVMFTSIFTIGGSMIASIQEQTMRQVGTSAHAGLQNLTMEQYEHFVRSPLIRDISYNIYLANAENDALRRVIHEIRYARDKMAEWNFQIPSVGRMPQTVNEIACSTITLDALGVPHEIGAAVTLEFTVGGVSYSEIFTLSGFWTGDPIMPAQQIWLSKEFVERVLAENIITDHYTGTVSADIWFNNAFDIGGKMRQLITERGFAHGEINYGINWAYAINMVDIDLTTVGVAVFALALVLLAGYLIIYSIFVISINTDIHFFGLIKTIGTTGRQIRKIVRGQALILSVIGIPVGLLAGYFFGAGLSPLMFNILAIEAVNDSRSASPFIFVFAAVFSLATVIIGCRKPAKIAASVSPVEAVKYSGIPENIKHKAKKTRRVTPLSMAWVNITREKRKLSVTILSLSLALILLNSAFSATRSFDMEAFLSGSIMSDFAVADYSLFSSAGRDRNTSGVTADFLQKAGRRGVSEISNIYYHDEAAAQVYGVGEQELRHFSDIDFDMLDSGNFAIASRQIISMGDNSLSVPEIGDILTLTNAHGVPRDFEIIGLVDSYPHHLSARFRTVNTLDVIISNNVFLDFFGTARPMQTNINVDAENISAFETWLADYISTQNPNLGFISRNTLQSEFDGLATTYLILGGSLSFILALVGILNFVNAIAVSIIARRRELAMLQSVGMTGKQLQQTLFFEGCFYAALSLSFTLTFGAMLGLLFVQIIAGQVWFFSQSFTVLPSVISAIPLAFICALVPLVCYKRLTRASLVERLRVE